MNVWTEHRNPEGRTYWFNPNTRESVWEKPDDLKTPFERALNQTKWKEYFSGGRKYYYNTETKESKWDMPDELVVLLETVEKDGSTEQAAVPKALPAPGFTPVGGANGSDPNQAQVNGNSLQVGAHPGGVPTPAAAAAGAIPTRPNLGDDPVIPHNGFATFEEGEKAFIHLLKKAGVDASWTWDQTMRAIITDPLYRALNSLSEKKTVYEKYTQSLRVKEKEEKEARLAKLRPALRNMLKGNPNVFFYSTFASADKLFLQHPIWQQAKIESERRLIFEEYVQELKQREVQESRATRARSVGKLMALLKTLEVDVVTRWRTAYSLITESDLWKSDAELRNLPTLDLLLAFEDYSRLKEREYEEQTRRAQVEKTRKERKARESFKELLKELVDSGHIKARTKWKDVYHLFKEDERYLSMLGNPGSNQLELFWDVVDEMDQILDDKVSLVTAAIAQTSVPPDGEHEITPGYNVTPESTEVEFLAFVKEMGNTEIGALSDEILHDVFTSLHGNVVKKQADEKRKAERRQRHLQDDFRYALKKLTEPLDVNMTYEDALPHMQDMAEFKAIEDEEARRAAFTKFVKRQKERQREVQSEDGGSTTSRKRKEPYREDRDRERDREYKERYDRESRSSRHHYRKDDYDSHAYKSSRASGHDRDRDERGRKHSHRDDREDRRRDKESRRSRSTHGRDWDEPSPNSKLAPRERSSSLYQEDPREKRDYTDQVLEVRAEKRPRYEKDNAQAMDVDKKSSNGNGRAESPEEGEI